MSGGAASVGHSAERDALAGAGRPLPRTSPEAASWATDPPDARRRPSAGARRALARRRATARRRGRLLVLSAIVALVVWGGAQVAVATGDASPTPETHVVQAGETLWEIVTVHYADSGRDIRALIAEVMAVNDLSDAALRPGQRITLPVAPD